MGENGLWTPPLPMFPSFWRRRELGLESLGPQDPLVLMWGAQLEKSVELLPCGPLGWMLRFCSNLGGSNLENPE